MSERNKKDYEELVLPSSIVTKKDLAHLITEAEAIDSTLTSNHVRDKAGIDGGLHYETTDQMKEFLTVNKINMGDSSGRRTETIKMLRSLKNEAPIIHLTFASNADYESLSQIVKWLRENVEKQAIVTVGLQPNLVGGVHIRTTNHVHDLSLRKQLEKHRDVLIKEVEAVSGKN